MSRQDANSTGGSPGLCAWFKISQNVDLLVYVHGLKIPQSHRLVYVHGLKISQSVDLLVYVHGLKISQSHRLVYVHGLKILQSHRLVYVHGLKFHKVWIFWFMCMV